MGSVKLVLVIGFLIFYGVMKYKFREIKDKQLVHSEEEQSHLMEYSIMTIFCIIGIGLILVQIYDLYMFGSNKYRDGKGVPLEEW